MAELGLESGSPWVEPPCLWAVLQGGEGGTAETPVATLKVKEEVAGCEQPADLVLELGPHPRRRFGKPVYVCSSGGCCAVRRERIRGSRAAGLVEMVVMTVDTSKGIHAGGI